MSNIQDRIRSVKEVQRFLKVELYGRSGTGKTSIAGTFPKPILILDVRDKGTESLNNHDDIDVLEIEKWSDIEEIYYYLVSGKHEYKTVVIDTVTQLQDLGLRHIVGDDAGVISRRAWGEAASLLKSWIMLFRDLDMHVVFTAQDRITNLEEDDDEEGGLDPEVGPYLMPSVAKVLNAAVGVAGRTFVREVPVGKDGLQVEMQYCLLVGPHPRYYSKLRRDPTLVTEVLPAVIVDPTYKKLWKMSHEEIRKKKKKTEVPEEPTKIKKGANNVAEASA